MNENFCTKLLTGLPEVVGSLNDPQSKASPTGLLASLYGHENLEMSSLEQIDPGTGHKKVVRITSKQRTHENDGIGKALKDCGDTAAERPYLEEEVDVTSYWQRDVLINESTVKNFCEAYSQLMKIPVQNRQKDGSNYIAVMLELYNDLFAQMNGFRRQLNDLIITQAIPKIGAYVGGVPGVGKPFDVMTAATNALIWKGFNEMDHEYRYAEMYGKKIVVGFGNFDLANSTLGIGCCNSEGSDFGKMAGNSKYQYWQDDQIEAQLGLANDFLMYAPGTMRLLTWNEYQGKFGDPIDNIQRGVIPDPLIPGLRYDLRIKEEGCAESYTAILGLHYDLWTVDFATAFGVGDKLENVNGIFKGNAQAV